MHPEQPLAAVLETLWQIPPPGPSNLWSSPEFLALKTLLVQRHRNGKSTFGVEIAIGNALKSLGLPCSTAHAPYNQIPDFLEVAKSLSHEFERTTTKRRYLCPLDLADDIPELQFGNVRVGYFSASELEALFEAPRLARCIPGDRLDAERLSKFHWLVVEEEVALGNTPHSRGFSFLDFRIDKDLGEIAPYSGRFPAVVEQALFFLLLAPWEDWAQMKEVDWRGFRLPWIYTLNDDLCAFPSPPPSPESLSWEPHFIQVGYDEWYESERPLRLQSFAGESDIRQALSHAKWTNFQAAKASDLFSTPVEHFMVRGFLGDGIDEVMAHLILIEAAFGAENDHKRKLRPKTDRHNESPTRRVAARLSAATGQPVVAKQYLALYDLRCTYIHGRADDRVISTEQRVLARRLAREAANAMVVLAQQGKKREEVLAQLLDQGVRNLPVDSNCFPKNPGPTAQGKTSTSSGKGMKRQPT
ncbi:hypothetical protein C4K14_4101 [Pseudomonas chlororaphis subsp. aureofaciens]|uniref:hypothetical protein n=1 Tax=Pseudomonas chlororaphis TaxID=587753 RepID=UPI000F6B400E|nr:hypothetical protein [Pseudomonas chlororaphis]AZD86923.1 hypothetical protein C4K14_4101 [Pseudomonas chlororaphis subsp. aureofaciens]